MTSDTEENAKAAIKQLGYDTKYGNGVDDGNRNIKVQVEVDEANVNDLFGLGLTYVARIVPNYKMSLVYDYLQIDEDLNESRKKTEPLLLIANTKK